MCLSVWVDLVGNLWKKVGKIINSWHFRGLDFSVMASVSILAITWPFLIRFELFKLLVKLDFKEHQTS